MGIWLLVFVVVPLVGGALLSPLIWLAHPLADNTNLPKSIFGVAALVVLVATVVGFIFGVAWFNRAVEPGWEWIASGIVVACVCWFVGMLATSSMSPRLSRPVWGRHR